MNPRKDSRLAHHPAVAVVIVNWNGPEDTIRCLKSLRRVTYPRYATVLVDNDSWDDSLEQISKFFAKGHDAPYEFVEYTKHEALAGGEEQKESKPLPARRLVLIQNDENLGHPGGINLAVEYLASTPEQPDYIYLLDNDATVEENCLTELVKLEQGLNCGIVGGIVLDAESGLVQYAPSGVFWDQFFPHVVRGVAPKPGTSKRYWPCSWVAGPSILIRWDVVQALRSQRGALLHPGLIMHGWELEFAQSCLRAGYQPFAAKDAVVHHKKRRAFGGTQSPMRHYYDVRNRILLARQLLPARWRAVFHVYNLTFALLRIVKVLRARRPDVARAIAAGLADGVRGIDGKWKDHDKEAIRPPNLTSLQTSKR